MYAIEENVAVPDTKVQKQKGEFALTVNALEVGKSFFAADKTKRGVYSHVAPKNVAPKKFILREATQVVAGVDGAPDTEVKGVRVWRTE